jgi:hypothetical protein
MWRTPLQHRRGNGYVYSSQFLTDDQAQDEIEKRLGHKIEPLLAAPLKFQSGRLEQSWKNNCLVTGMASSFIEPLEATGLYLTVFGIRLLGQYLQQQITDQVYNKAYNSEFDAVLDFVVAHYKYSKRDNEYWQHYNTVGLELYRPNGIFPDRSWDYIIDGFNDNGRELKIKAESILKLRKGLHFSKWMQHAGYSK